MIIGKINNSVKGNRSIAKREDGRKSHKSTANLSIKFIKRHYREYNSNIIFFSITQTSLHFLSLVFPKFYFHFASVRLFFNVAWPAEKAKTGYDKQV